MKKLPTCIVLLSFCFSLPSVSASDGESPDPQDRQRNQADHEGFRPEQEGRLEYSSRVEATASTMYFPIFMGTYNNVPIPPVTREKLQMELFDGPTSGCGTISEYFAEVSYGNFSLVGTVYDWVTTSEDDTYYTQGISGISNPEKSAKTHEFLAEILDKWDPTVDFGQFDNDGPDNLPNSGDDDGYVDLVGFAHPEIDASVGGGPDNMWAHQSSMSYETSDSSANGGFIKIDGYFMHSALKPDGLNPQVVGPFVHELLHGIGLFGRGMGLPDSYDTGFDPEKSGCYWDPSGGIGAWDATGAGASDTCPPHVNPYFKARAGWVNPSVVTTDLTHWPLISSTLTPTVMKLWANGEPSTEYFLVENRTREGFNSEIPAGGVLIWHVNENENSFNLNQVTANECTPVLDLECADQTGPDHTLNADDIDAFPNPGNLGDAGDPFCDGDSFNGSSIPSSDAYNGDSTGVEVDNILYCGQAEMFADLVVGVVIWDDELCMRDCGADVCTVPSNCEVFWESPEIYIDNDQDGIIDPPVQGGENILCTTVRNIGQTYSAPVTVSFYYDDPGMGMLWPPADTSKKIGEAVIPLLWPGESEKACVNWTIPIPPPDVNHWCIGAIATSPYDLQTFEHPPADNNVAQINMFALYDKAGTAVPTLEADTSWFSPSQADPPFEWQQTVQVCNPNRGQCNFTIRVGSPPLYDDAVIPPDFNVMPEFTAGSLGGFECIPMTLSVTDTHPVHTDYANIPVTLLCDDRVVGGVRLEFHVDNVPPLALCTDFSAKFIRNLSETTGALHHPSKRAVQITWKDSPIDELGFDDRVERWMIYNGDSPDFEPMLSNLVARTAIDEETSTALHDHWVDLSRQEGQTWYKIVAVDRAGNRSSPCTTEVEIEQFSPFIFFDSFESGGTGAWSTVIP